MQKVIRNLGRNLDNMNVYSLFIFNISAVGSYLTEFRLQKYKKNNAFYRVVSFFYR